MGAATVGALQWPTSLRPRPLKKPALPSRFVTPLRHRTARHAPSHQPTRALHAIGIPFPSVSSCWLLQAPIGFCRLLLPPTGFCCLLMAPGDESVEVRACTASRPAPACLPLAVSVRHAVATSPCLLASCNSSTFAYIEGISLDSLDLRLPPAPLSTNSFEFLPSRAMIFCSIISLDFRRV